MTTPTMTEIVTEMARYVKHSGFSVDWNTSMPWVAIQCDETDSDGFFLEDADAEEFIGIATKNAAEADVSLATGMLAQAKQYVDCL